MPGLLDPTDPNAPSPNFLASLAPPQISATPRPGYGNIMAPQAPQTSIAQPTMGAGLTQDDVQQALGMLYGQLGGGVDWAKFTGGAQGLLGNAAVGQAPGAAAAQPGQHPSAGAQTLVDAYKGFQQFHDIDQQIQQAKQLFDNPDGGYHGREGGGIV